MLKEGAQLAGSVADVIEELSLSYPDLRAHQNAGPVLKPTSLNQRQRNVLEVIDLEPRSVDSVVKQTGMVTAEVLQTLVELELVGFVSSVAGCYQLCSDWSRD